MGTPLEKPGLEDVGLGDRVVTGGADDFGGAGGDGV